MPKFRVTMMLSDVSLAQEYTVSAKNEDEACYKAERKAQSEIRTKGPGNWFVIDHPGSMSVAIQDVEEL